MRRCCTSGSGSHSHVERTVSWDHRKLGLPSTPPGVRIAVAAPVAVSPAEAIAAYGSPSFYEDRRTRDDIAVLGVVDHEDRGDRVVLEVHFAFVGSVSGAVRARHRPGEDVVDHPDRALRRGGRARPGRSCPTTTPTA